MNDPSLNTAALSAAKKLSLAGTTDLKTALIIKHCCAHGAYTTLFTGNLVTTCPTIG